MECPLQSPPPGSLSPGGATAHPIGVKTFIIPLKILYEYPGKIQAEEKPAPE
jgi:hypothetical protein